MITPIVGLGAATGPGPQELARIINKGLQPFYGQTSITASVESVTFSDGTAYGADSNHGLASLQARLDAEHRLAREIVSRWLKAKSPGEVVSWIRGMAQGPQPSAIEASRENDAGRAYAMFYALNRSIAARAYLTLAEKDFPAMIGVAERAGAARNTLKIYYQR